MTIQQSLVLLKPDTVERGLIGEIIGRFERAGLRIIGLKLLRANEDKASDHYGDLVERYTEKLGKERAVAIKRGMVEFLTSGPLVALVIEGVDACAVIRKLVGSTYPNEALPGTIRGDFAHMAQAYANDGGFAVKNMIHASGNEAEAKIEIALWFTPEELLDYEPVHEKHTRK